MSLFDHLFAVNESNTIIDVPAYEGYIEPSLDGMQDAVAENAREMYTIAAGLYLVDASLERKSVLEGANVESLLEGAVSNALERMQGAIIRLWQKVKAWFNSAIEYFQIMFSSGEKFVKKFEKQITDKNVSGFTYDGYKWDMKGGDQAAEIAIGAAEVALSELVGNIKQLKDNKLYALNAGSHAVNGQGVDKGIAAHDNSDDYKKSDVKAEFFKKTGYDDMSELKEKITAKYHGGDKQEITDFSVISKSTMLTDIKGLSQVIGDIKQAKAENDKVFSDAIKNIKSAIAQVNSVIKGSGEDADARRRTATTRAQRIVTMINNFLSIRSSITTLRINMHKAYASECLSALKAYLHYKPTKESFEDENPEGGSGEEDLDGGENAEQSDTMLSEAMKHFSI